MKGGKEEIWLSKVKGQGQGPGLLFIKQSTLLCNLVSLYHRRNSQYVGKQAAWQSSPLTECCSEKPPLKEEGVSHNMWGNEMLGRGVCSLRAFLVRGVQTVNQLTELLTDNRCYCHCNLFIYSFLLFGVNEMKCNFSFFLLLAEFSKHGSLMPEGLERRTSEVQQQLI